MAMIITYPPGDRYLWLENTPPIKGFSQVQQSRGANFLAIDKLGLPKSVNPSTIH